MSLPRTTAAAQAERVPAWLPPPALLVGLAAGAIVVGVTLAKGLQDADFFWHLTAGNWILDNGRVPDTDPFSFTWGGMAWTTHEWLSELVIALLVNTIGTVGAMVIFGMIAASVPVMSALALFDRGVRSIAIAGGVGLGTLVIFPYLTVRPQVISWTLMAALVWSLLALRPDRPWRLAALPPLFALWANLHGLYVVGFGFLGLYVLFSLGGRTAMADRRWLVVAACIGAVAASMLTPAGPGGLLYPLRYVDAGDWGLANIQEWQSPDFHNPAHWPLLAMVLALAVNGGRGAPGWLATLSYVTLAMALISMRNAPIAAVAAIPVLAMGLDTRLPRRSTTVRNARARRVLEIAVTGVVMVVSLIVLVPRDPSAATPDALARRYPVASLDLLEKTDPDVRLLAEYGWGGYAISRLHAGGGRVFVDGRNDMYDQQILEDYSAIRAAEEGWEDLTERYGVEAILFPPAIVLVHGVAQDAGWCEAYRDEVQVLLLRTCRTTAG